MKKNKQGNAVKTFRFRGIYKMNETHMIKEIFAIPALIQWTFSVSFVDSIKLPSASQRNVLKIIEYAPDKFCVIQKGWKERVETLPVCVCTDKSSPYVKWQLAEPGALMSAKAYRDKKALPLVEKLKEVVKNLTIKCVQLAFGLWSVIFLRNIEILLRLIFL